MTQKVIHVRATSAEIVRAVQMIPQTTKAGGAVADAILTRVGLAILARIHRAFVVKSRGGTDEAGLRWAPLSPTTIAYSRRGGRSRTEGGRASRPSQALNAKQQARWWELYRQGLAMFWGNKGRAAARAWTILKGEGATTLRQKYGNRSVEILRDTGLLLNSLSPGAVTDEQVFHVASGAVAVGTNRRGAGSHHRGIPGRLPRRPLWPDPDDWPQSWWDDVTDQVRDGIIDIATQLIHGAR